MQLTKVTNSLSVMLASNSIHDDMGYVGYTYTIAALKVLLRYALELKQIVNSFEYLLGGEQHTNDNIGMYVH